MLWGGMKWSWGGSRFEGDAVSEKVDYGCRLNTNNHVEVQFPPFCTLFVPRVTFLAFYRWFCGRVFVCVSCSRYKLRNSNDVLQVADPMHGGKEKAGESARKWGVRRPGFIPDEHWHCWGFAWCGPSAMFFLWLLFCTLCSATCVC